ncbi:hypothetical protein U1Q18_013529, partial [Sarracenia purpurea var. burkii]
FQTSGRRRQHWSEESDLQWVSDGRQHWSDESARRCSKEKNQRKNAGRKKFTGHKI